MLKPAATIAGVSGLFRSLRIYRSRHHLASLTKFYGEIAPDCALMFDVGAHVGDRVTAFRRLGANVVAIEPQPALARYLRIRFAGDRKVRIVQLGIDAAEGTARLHVNRRNPTVTTVSDAFVSAAADATGWDGQVWDETRDIEVTTLDAMISRHGMPGFIKIDTEGHEPAVLRGLTAPVAKLSFEITTIARDAGLSAIDECVRLGFREYRLTLGESHEWHSHWVNAETMRSIVAGLPAEANSGDVVARR